jgi:hypothetical protein
LEDFLKAGHYHKTEIEIISVNDLDGETPSIPQEKNLLREKTFNSELNQLVNKIFTNEKINEEPVELPEEIDLTGKNNLLLKCEELIYRLKHFEDCNTATAFYNPFDADINVYDDIDDTADYIKTGLLQCGHHEYQILKYNFNDKAYRSDINMLEESYSTGIYFSNNDPVIKRIQSSAEGFIIKPDLIASDPFFSKKFISDGSNSSNMDTFYIVKISNLFNDSINMEKLGDKISKFEDFLSPLILLKLTGNTEYKTEEILSSLKRTASIPMMLYFLKNRIKFNITNSKYEDTLLMIELFIKSSINTRIKSYIITLKDYSVKDNLFIFKFFISRVKKFFSHDSLILQISINRAIIVTTLDADEIFKSIDRVNSETELLTVDPVDYSGFLNSKEFVNLFL